MNLTLKGFLRGYVRELTGLETDSLKRLLEATLNSAPAAEEAVMAFAAAQGKAAYLAKLAKGTRLEEPYREASERIDQSTDLESFFVDAGSTERYRKVWLAYCAKKDAIKADRRAILLMRDKTLEAMAATQHSIYGVCKELGLNQGNVYAYLNKGDASKVSRATARRIMEFTRS